MSGSRSPVTRRFASIGVTVLGIVLAATPLALWVAWTPFGFMVVLGTAAVSVVLLGFLMSSLPAETGDPRSGDSDETRPMISDEFVEEIHKLLPLTYHHSRIEKARFRRTMARLRHLQR